MSEAGWPDEFRKGRSFEALGQEVASAAKKGQEGARGGFSSNWRRGLSPPPHRVLGPEQPLLAEGAEGDEAVKRFTEML